MNNKLKLFSCLLCLFVSNSIISQSSLKLFQFEKFANCSEYSSFDTEARKLGYSYNNKYSEEKHDEYLYIKEIETKDFFFTLSLSYIDYGDNKPVIKFICSSNALPNQILDLKKEVNKPTSNYTAQSRDCKKVTGNPFIDGRKQNNYLAFCYESKAYDLRIYDIPRINNSDNRYNEIQIKIYKK